MIVGQPGVTVLEAVREHVCKSLDHAERADEQVDWVGYRRRRRFRKVPFISLSERRPSRRSKRGCKQYIEHSLE
jgi:hypothetical protein